MTVSTRDRQALDDWCREQMGPERARTLMELLPNAKARRSWWQPADPEQSFWVQHGIGRATPGWACSDRVVPVSSSGRTRSSGDARSRRA